MHHCCHTKTVNLDFPGLFEKKKGSRILEGLELPNSQNVQLEFAPKNSSLPSPATQSLGRNFREQVVKKEVGKISSISKHRQSPLNSKGNEYPHIV